MANYRVCYKCEKRSLGCHAGCEEYILERKRIDKLLDKKVEISKKKRDVISSNKQAVKNYNRWYQT